MNIINEGHNIKIFNSSYKKPSPLYRKISVQLVVKGEKTSFDLPDRTSLSSAGPGWGSGLGARVDQYKMGQDSSRIRIKCREIGQTSAGIEILQATSGLNLK